MHCHLCILNEIYVELLLLCVGSLRRLHQVLRQAVRLALQAALQVARLAVQVLLAVRLGQLFHNVFVPRRLAPAAEDGVSG